MSVNTVWVADHVALTTMVHSHAYYQLIYCRGGCGAVEINGKQLTMSSGNACLVLPMQDHRIIQTDGLRIVELKFTVANEKLDLVLRQLPRKLTIGEHSELYSSLAQVLDEGLYQTLYRREATDSALMLFIIRLIRSNAAITESRSHSFVLETSKSKDVTHPNERDADFLRVIDYIENHLSEPITLDDLTKLVHLDKSYLIVRFKEKWGIPPMKYVNWVRIERAKILLAVTDKSITDIAEAVGFGSVHYFSRFFKDKEKLTPNDYRLLRKNNRQKEE